MSFTNTVFNPRGEPTKSLVGGLRKLFQQENSNGSENSCLKFHKDKNVKKTTQREDTVLFAIGCRELYSKEIQRVILAETGKKFSDGTIYPIIKSLSDKKLIIGRWGDETSNCGGRRRYYRLSDAGWQCVGGEITSKLNLLFADIPN